MDYAKIVTELKKLATNGKMAVSGLRSLGAAIPDGLDTVLDALLEVTESEVIENATSAAQENVKLLANLDAAYETLAGWADTLEDNVSNIRRELPSKYRPRRY